MMALLVALMGVFPISFLAYVISERLSVTHQSRVGRGIHFSQYLAQHWADWFADYRTIPSLRVALLYLAQLSAVIFVFLDFPGGIFLYLAVNWALLVFTTHDELEVFERVSSDRSQIRFLIGTLTSSLCVLGAGIAAGSLVTSDTAWSMSLLLFLLPFIVSGMILFGEHPFSPLYPRVYWFKSSRFFVWCMLGSHLFLGGLGFGVDFFIKATGIYLLARLFGQYFPRYSQADLIRVMTLYLVPLVFLSFVLVGVLHA